LWPSLIFSIRKALLISRSLHRDDTKILKHFRSLYNKDTHSLIKDLKIERHTDNTQSEENRRKGAGDVVEHLQRPEGKGQGETTVPRELGEGPEQGGLSSCSVHELEKESSSAIARLIGMAAANLLAACFSSCEKVNFAGHVLS
jgi:hypothetical protein